MQKILIVDDTSSFRLPLAAFLRREGFETYCAANGKDGLELAVKHRPDLILLDVAMPVLDGIACLEMIRSVDSLRNVPVLMLTAMSESDVVTRAVRSGVNGYILKSQFSLGSLVDAVKLHLGQHKPADPSSQTVVPENLRID